MHMVAARLDCERAMVSTWWVTSHRDCMTGLETLLSPCRGLVSGKEGCLVSGWEYDYLNC